MSALAEALIAAQAELPTALKRDADNADAGYRYMTLDALIAATRPILNKHGIAIMQAPTTLDRRNDDGSVSLVPALTTVLCHAGDDDYAGEAIRFVTPLYLQDKSMQSLGAAITYARRYAWASALGIAAEEDTDAAPLDDGVALLVAPKITCECGTCKKCKHREYMRDYYRRDPQRIRDIALASRNRRIEYVREYDRQRGFRVYDEAKVRARAAVTRALTRGQLVRQACEVCGDVKTDAHHGDYSKPLEVQWLCRTHHMEVHRVFV